MFPQRYFPGRFFAARYWPKVGAQGASLPGILTSNATLIQPADYAAGLIQPVDYAATEIA